MNFDMLQRTSKLKSFWLICALVCFAAMPVPVAKAQGVDFARDILPILNESCVQCHGPDKQKSGFRLDSRLYLLKGGDSGELTLVPGDSGGSSIIAAVGYEDVVLEMPPKGKLSDDKIDLLTRWVEQGAVWPGQMDIKVVDEKSDHWSFQPVVRPEVPGLDGDAPAKTPVDAFLLSRLAKEGLEPSPDADARSLIRRASIVLTGLPPEPEAVEVFAEAFAVDQDAAYAELVDHLLDSPHFGERWAQHWLDVIRWAETNGSESNMYRKNAWIYRDYVIRAFNEDKPYDRFLFEQIAGDTVGQGDATGYLVAGPHVPVATVGREPEARRQARADRLDEVLQTVGASALGMTIGCARCHNHKFDPISIDDYYAMSAVFEDIEFGSRYPELAEDHPRRVRGKELTEQIVEKRQALIKMGPWQELWSGFLEVRFPVVKTQSIRVTFTKKRLFVDEFEVFGPQQWQKNLARPSEGTTVDIDEALLANPIEVDRLNDGRYGTEVVKFFGVKDNEAHPWFQYNFTEPKAINRLRMSSNREDHLETDYLTDIRQPNFNTYRVEILGEDGQWQELVSARKLATSKKKQKDRARLLDELHALIHQINEEGPKPSFVARFIEPAKTHVLSRGSPENPRQEVFASGLNELGGDLGVGPEASGKKRRTAFASWVIDPENPLTARVAANRLWHHVFGQGIVTTTSDFGSAGALPTHPELLDWLAAELVEPSVDLRQRGASAHPWSMKYLLRLMVMSHAFRQSSLPATEALAVDAGSSLLWRFPPKRVEAEVIRDAILQSSGVLDEAIGGRSFRIHNVKKRYAQWEVVNNHGPETHRRMIYQERMRRVDDQMFTAFDFPDCGQVRAKRPVSTTPLQALNLLNSQFVISQSELIAARAEQEAGGDLAASVDRCFELLLAREPSPDEREACLELAEKTSLAFVCRALVNANEFAFLP